MIGSSDRIRLITLRLTAKPVDRVIPGNADSASAQGLLPERVPSGSGDGTLVAEEARSSSLW